MTTQATSRELVALLGLPTTEAYMKMYDVPTELEIGVIPKRVYCSRMMQLPLEAAFHNIVSRDKVDELKTWDGCFNIRNKRGGTTFSMHSWGLAIDINARWNGFGQTPTMTQELVRCFTDEGFIWGGRWVTPDGMHFELCKELIIKYMQ